MTISETPIDAGEAISAARTIVFSGPSLAESDLHRLSTATHAPPIKRGDLAAVDGYDIVVILDGEFGQSESVSPKEILAIIARGKTVIGAASMGALRASELDRDGMIGVGWVYEHFRRQTVRRDADVALAYSTFNFEPMSVPLVDVAYWMERASAAGLIGPRERSRALKAARSIFFADRTTDRLVHILQRSIGDSMVQALLGFSGGGIPSVKTLDALEAVRLSISYTKRGTAD